RFVPPVHADQIPALRQRAAVQDGSYLARYALAVTASDAYMQTMEMRRRQARGVWQAYFRTRDAFLLPTALVPAFPHDPAGTPLMRVLATPRGERPYMDICFWTSFASLAGLPATTAPVGLTPGGLPVGVQIVGPHLEDATPIDLARRLAGGRGRVRVRPGTPPRVAPPPAGLPVGVQIVGPYLEDATPIDLAGRLADVVGGFRPPPGVCTCRRASANGRPSGRSILRSPS